MFQPFFDENKAINAVLYIANKLSRKDFHKIFKIIYFADREHLMEYGRPISGDIYNAMKDGPVPSKIYDIFKSVRGDGYFTDTGKFSIFFTVKNWDLIEPIKEADTNVLSKSDLKHLDNSLQKYGNLSWDEIKEKSHDYAWHHTVLDGRIAYEDIIIEAGGDSVYIEYLKEINTIQNACI